jgi:hypothetical protein
VAQPTDPYLALIQCMLNSLGYQAGAETGLVTVDSTAAWLWFQRVHRLPPDAALTVQILLRDYATHITPAVRRCSMPQTPTLHRR